LSEIIDKTGKNRILYIILGSGFFFKLLYLFCIGPAIFPNWSLTTQDSHSYINSFINLVNAGHYTHNPKISEASYGRLPVVVFLWGLFYLLLGKAKASLGFAVFQIVLDAFATYFIYRIFLKFFSKRIALVASVTHAFFPLTTYFVVKTDTEYLALFLIITVLYKLVYFKNDVKNCIALGILLITGFYIRETLLILIPISFFYLLRNYDLKIKEAFIILITFLVLYLPWPIRNYSISNKIVLVKPLSAGYADYQKDMLGYMYWLYAWHKDQPDEYLAYAYKLDREIIFPEEVFASETEKQLAVNTIKLAQRCGTSFVEWQRDAGKKIKCYGCYDELIEQSFSFLKESYKSNHPFNYYIGVPLANLKKAFFKTSLTNSQTAPGWLFKFVMLLRCTLIFTGLFACFYYWKNDLYKVIFGFFVVKYLFVTAILRQVEMRYIFQSDVLIIIGAVVFIASMIERKNKPVS
jgi:hypothetical protein